MSINDRVSLGCKVQLAGAVVFNFFLSFFLVASFEGQFWWRSTTEFYIAVFKPKRHTLPFCDNRTWSTNNEINN